MGRLNKSNITTTSSENLSGTTSSDIHIFIDEYGNVTQINKKEKDSRLKFYIDPTMPQADYIADCVIGISGPTGQTFCTYGVGLGLGDNTFGRATY